MRKWQTQPSVWPKAGEWLIYGLMHFDLTDLRLVLNVAEAASITHGATRSGLSLAAASERIRDLEQALGVTLFERKRRGVSLTPAGQALIHHARVVMQQLELMRGELGKFAKGLRGSVRLLSNTAALQEFLPPLLGPFLSAHPNIDIAVEERPSPEIVRSIARGVAHIGIVADAVDPASELETFPFAEDRLVLVAPAKHPLAHRRRVAFADALAYDFVGLPTGVALQDHIDSNASRAGRELRLRVRVPGFDAICRVVESGIGLAVVPKTAATRCRQTLSICVVPLTDAWALRHLRLCVKDARALPAHAEWLLTHLRAHAS